MTKSENAQRRWDENREEMMDNLHQSEKYKKCEGKHQLEDHEQWKTYMREYQREWRKAHPGYYASIQRGKYASVKKENKRRKLLEKIAELQDQLNALEQQ